MFSNGNFPSIGLRLPDQKMLTAYVCVCVCALVCDFQDTCMKRERERGGKSRSILEKYNHFVLILM